MNTQPKQLYRSRSNRYFAGVCGGLAEYLSIDPTVIRLLFAFGVIFGFGTLLVVYLVMMIVVPEAPANPVIPQEEYLPPQT